MKINPLLNALALCLVAASPAFAEDTKASPAPAAAPAAQPAVVAAPTYTDAQLLEEFGWYIGKRTGLSDLGLSASESELLSKGLVSAMSGKDSPYEIQKIGPAMTDYIQKKQAVVLETIKNKNAAQGAAYFEKLKEIKDVVELPDGLRYEIIKQGTGNPPKPTDTVKVNYTGALVDGTVFDSSDRQGKPGEFVLNSVIAGWTEGLQKLSKGGKMRLFVPPVLGYGDDGRPGIPPGSVLVFEIELLDITSTPPAPADAALPAGK